MENVTEIIKELHTNFVNEHYMLMVIVDSVTWQRINGWAWRRVCMCLYVCACMHVCVCLESSCDQHGLLRLLLFSWFEMLCEPLVVKTEFKLYSYWLHHIHLKPLGGKPEPILYRKRTINVRQNYLAWGKFLHKHISNLVFQWRFLTRFDSKLNRNCWSNTLFVYILCIFKLRNIPWRMSFPSFTAGIRRE